MPHELSRLQLYVDYYLHTYSYTDSGANPGFCEGGSEHRSESLKQGVWKL